VIHSPYEEPRVLTFPASDPEFAFDIGYREADLGEHRFTPSPFDRVLLGLAELGILVTDKPRMVQQWTGTFRPFDIEPIAEAEPVDGPRTTSRFDFARSRAQSTEPDDRPFASFGQVVYGATRY
jgi:CCR4-NOT transcription complex subunit 4